MQPAIECITETVTVHSVVMTSGECRGTTETQVLVNVVAI